MRKLLKRVEKVSAEEYDERRKELFEIGSTSRTLHAPDSKEFRKEVIRIFSRSNHWLCKPVFIYKNQGRELSYYIFSRAKLVTERQGNGCVTVVFPNSLENNFKHHVMKRLYALDETVYRQYQRRVVDWDSLCELSNLLHEWAQKETDTSFGVWMRYNA